MTKHVIEELVLECKGSSIESSFSDAAMQMFNIVINTLEVQPMISRSFIIRDKDLKQLLYQFLKKLFDMANSELFLLSSVKKLSIEDVNGEYMLNASIVGDKLKDHKVKDIVKQVVDRNTSVKEDREGCTSHVTLVVERLHEI